MSSDNPRGLVYRCPLCGAEVVVLARRFGTFTPRCCNRDMVPLRHKLTFYVCPVCGVEVAVVKMGSRSFTPRCCNEDMSLAA